MGNRKWSTLIACAALCVACGESRTIDETDAAIVVNLDGAMIDGGVDAGPPSNVGAACTSAADCTGIADVCLPSSELTPGGYCSRTCPGGAGCPDGSICMNFGGGQTYCVQSCDPEAAERECRTGYGCADHPMLPAPFCIGGCEESSECPDGLLCDPEGGDLGEGNCYDPSAEWGAPCESERECPMGAFCYAEEFTGWPGGVCMAFGCDPDANTGCPDGQTCVASTGAGGVCLTSCTEDGDECRDGYRCGSSAAQPDRNVCRPGCERAPDGSSPSCSEGRVCNPGLGTCDAPFPAGQLGDACSRRTGGCTGGTCYTEFQTGYPGAYCVYEGCTIGDDTTCPDGGVCVPSSSGGELGLCHRACDVASPDCRDGYLCRDVDGEAGPLTATACMPGCTSNSQCANDGATCQLLSGLCSTSG